MDFLGTVCTFNTNETASNKVDSDRLAEEIRASNMIIALDRIDSSNNEWKVYFKAALGQEDISTFTALVSAHTGEALITPPAFKFDTFGNQLISDAGKAGNKETYISFNWCDKTTWYQNAVRVTDEVLTNSGNNKNYTVASSPIIDVTHWKVSDEATKAEITQHRPIVKVNGTAYQECYYVGNTLVSPANGYTIDYESAGVVFVNELLVSDEVTMSYSKLPTSNKSHWAVKAPEGHRVTLTKAEIQFSDDVSMTDAVRFVPYSTIGLDPLLDPVKLEYNLPDGTEIALCTLDPSLEKRFDNKIQIIDDADGYYFIPSTPIETRGLRDLAYGLHVYKWNYEGVENMELNSALGRFIKIFLESDIELAGSRVTATLYGSKRKL